MAAPAQNIPALVRRVRAGSAAHQSAALAELAAAARQGPEARSAIVAAGGLSLLVQRMHSSSAAVQARACQALLALGGSACELVVAASAAGAVTTALDLLRPVASRSSGTSAWMEDVGTSLLNLLFHLSLPNTKARTAISAEAGTLIQAAVQVLQYSRDSSALASAAGFLCLLMNTQPLELCEAAVAAGAAPVLVQRLCSGNSRVVSGVLATLSRLCSAGPHAAIAAGCVPALVQLAHRSSSRNCNGSDGEALLLSMTVCFQTLAVHCAQCRQAVAEAGGIAALERWQPSSLARCTPRHARLWKASHLLPLKRPPLQQQSSLGRRQAQRQQTCQGQRRPACSRAVPLLAAGKSQSASVQQRGAARRAGSSAAPAAAWCATAAHTASAPTGQPTERPARLHKGWKPRELDLKSCISQRLDQSS
ncbi:hypothetical protein ABPG75_002888 [Micractinium tetrahymenae]